MDQHYDLFWSKVLVQRHNLGDIFSAWYNDTQSDAVPISAQKHHYIDKQWVQTHVESNFWIYIVNILNLLFFFVFPR